MLFIVGLVALSMAVGVTSTRSRLQRWLTNAGQSRRSARVAVWITSTTLFLVGIFAVALGLIHAVTIGLKGILRPIVRDAIDAFGGLIGGLGGWKSAGGIWPEAR